MNQQIAIGTNVTPNADVIGNVQFMVGKPSDVRELFSRPLHDILSPTSFMELCSSSAARRICFEACYALTTESPRLDTIAELLYPNHLNHRREEFAQTDIQIPQLSRATRDLGRKPYCIDYIERVIKNWLWSNPGTITREPVREAYRAGQKFASIARRGYIPPSYHWNDESRLIEEQQRQVEMFNKFAWEAFEKLINRDLALMQMVEMVKKMYQTGKQEQITKGTRKEIEQAMGQSTTNALEEIRRLIQHYKEQMGELNEKSFQNPSKDYGHLRAELQKQIDQLTQEQLQKIGKGQQAGFDPDSLTHNAQEELQSLLNQMNLQERSELKKSAEQLLGEMVAQTGSGSQLPEPKDKESEKTAAQGSDKAIAEKEKHSSAHGDLDESQSKRPRKNEEDATGTSDSGSDDETGSIHSNSIASNFLASLLREEAKRIRKPPPVRRGYEQFIVPFETIEERMNDEIVALYSDLRRIPPAKYREVRRRGFPTGIQVNPLRLITGVTTSPMDLLKAADRIERIPITRDIEMIHLLDISGSTSHNPIEGSGMVTPLTFGLAVPLAAGERLSRSSGSGVRLYQSVYAFNNHVHEVVPPGDTLSSRSKNIIGRLPACAVEATNTFAVVRAALVDALQEPKDRLKVIMIYTDGIVSPQYEAELIELMNQTQTARYKNNIIIGCVYLWDSDDIKESLGNTTYIHHHINNYGFDFGISHKVNVQSSRAAQGFGKMIGDVIRHIAVYSGVDFRQLSRVQNVFVNNKYSQLTIRDKNKILSFESSLI